MESAVGGVALEVARTSDVAPFIFQVTVAGEHTESILTRLIEAGAYPANAEALELARILAGWPRLASEVDEKTIPQEVRFDEIGGDAYTTGLHNYQVAGSRLHFYG